jgi:hypothetical protein
MESLFGVAAHDGIDFALPEGTPVIAADDGVIISAGPGLYGTTIVISHSWGKSYYGHLSDVIVKPDDRVTQGTVIGRSGSTGIATGPHLHFGIQPLSPNMANGYHGMVDPSLYLQSGESQAILGAHTSARPQRYDPLTTLNTIKHIRREKSGDRQTGFFTKQETYHNYIDYSTVGDKANQVSLDIADSRPTSLDNIEIKDRLGRPVK